MQKIKRTKNIYRRRHRNPIVIIVLAVAGVIALVLGYSLAGTVSKLISNGSKVTAKATSSVVSRINSSSSKATGSSKVNSSSSTAPNNIRGIFLSKSYLSDTASLDNLIASAKQVNINLAVVELKGEDGAVNYASKTTEVTSGGLAAKNAPDASTAAQELTKNGITPAAKISCFKDPLGANAMRDAAIMYSGNHSMTWLDYKNQRWLNPYSTKAQQYIIDLAKEAVSLGYKQIYLDNVEFPTDNSGKNAYFGDNLSSREDALKTFVASVTQQVEAEGGKVSVMMPGSSLAGQENELTGLNQSIYGFTADYFSPNLCPSLLGSNATFGSTVISAPDEAPGDTVSAAAQLLKQQASDKTNVTVPFIQAASIDSGEKQYTADDINAQITALKNAGITNFILYSSAGTYSLNGVNSQ